MSREKNGLDFELLKKIDDDLFDLSSKYSHQTEDLIYRIGDFVKDKLKVIPRPEVFTRWVLENNVLKYDRDVTEEELFECARHYLLEIETKFRESAGLNLQSPVDKKKFQSKVYSLNWTGDNDDLMIMFNFLNPAFIDKETEFETFKNIFSNNVSLAETPVRWTESSRLLTYFFEILLKNRLITNNRYSSVIEASALFVNYKGKKVTSHDLTSAKNAYMTLDKFPQNADILERLISMLKH